MNLGRLRIPVRLVLDRSALHAYTQLSMAVGETLHEVVHDGGARFGVPVAVLADVVADADTHGRRLLTELAGLDACVVLPAFANEWRVLAALRAALGRLDLAMSARAALVCAAPILTDEPSAYDVKGGPEVIAIW